MDINRVDYFTVALLGNLNDFLQKMNAEKMTIARLQEMRDSEGSTILQTAIASLRFDIANYLLDHNYSVNNISKARKNELHSIADRIAYDEAVNLGERLLNLEVDLNLQDRAHKNTPFMTLLVFGLGRGERQTEFLMKCLQKKPDIFLKNKSGLSPADIINQRGNEEMKKVVKGLLL